MANGNNLRVLIISHNPMNLSENNGRTLRNLFSEMKAESISHLFFHGGEIDAPFCNSFYRITDFEIRDSLLRFRKPGKVLFPNDYDSNQEKENKEYVKYCEKPPFMRFLRDFAWGFGTWKTRKLKEWLKEISPNVIFFYGSDSAFCQRIANWVSNYLKIPMLIYWVDDCYLKLKKQKGFITKLNNHRFMRISKKNILKSKNLCITPAMAKAYENEFGNRFEVLFNSSFLEPFAKRAIEKPLKMSYLGNIGLGRCESLLKIGSIIDEHKLPIVFSVYSNEKRENLLAKIKSGKGLTFCGGLSYDEVLKVMNDSDVLIHVEDFSSENVEYCRYSLSTKIADSLASNRCLLCYGPSEIASIDYLAESAGALVASDESELCSVLLKICEDTSVIYTTAERGLELFKNNHSSKTISDKLFKHLNKLIR